MSLAHRPVLNKGPGESPERPGKIPQLAPKIFYSRGPFRNWLGGSLGAPLQANYFVHSLHNGQNRRRFLIYGVLNMTPLHLKSLDTGSSCWNPRIRQKTLNIFVSEISAWQETHFVNDDLLYFMLMAKGKLLDGDSLKGVPGSKNQLNIRFFVAECSCISNPKG